LNHIVCNLVVVSTLAAALAPRAAARAQALPDSLLAQVRAGAARLVMPADSTTAPLVGSPTLPVVEIRLNGRGPFRFLIDLGSNVVIVRKNVVTAAAGQTLVRRTNSDIVQFDSLRLGGARFDHIVAGAYDSLDVDGVIGYNLLRLTPFTLDYPAGRFSLHKRRLSEGGDGVLPYQVEGRMPYLWVRFGRDSVLANLDTGASEWFTLPSAYHDSIKWERKPTPGPTVTNNQTGTRPVLAGQSRDSLLVGPLRLGPGTIYVNADADAPWLGSASLRYARWTFDPGAQRVEIVPVRVPSAKR
jgi:hypothetical protein